ncbi:MAG: ribosome biogenesis GTP-binding protein YihA/YsxC [Sandaracinaceae bacterium]
MASDRPSSVQVLDATFVAAATRHQELPPPAHAEIAFGGRSNVGKSSLINRLLGRRRLVRTSSTPGATRGLALFRARLRLAGEEARLDLVDLPGYGFARRSKVERRSWGPMIESFLEHRVGLRALVVILDVRRGPEDDDRELLAYLDHIGRRAVIVATKVDKLPGSQRKLAVSAVRQAVGRPVLGVSGVTGEGLDRLWSLLLRVAHLSGGDVSGEPPAGPGGG